MIVSLNLRKCVYCYSHYCLFAFILPTWDTNQWYPMIFQLTLLILILMAHTSSHARSLKRAKWIRKIPHEGGADRVFIKDIMIYHWHCWRLFRLSSVQPDTSYARPALTMWPSPSCAACLLAAWKVAQTLTYLTCVITCHIIPIWWELKYKCETLLYKHTINARWKWTFSLIVCSMHWHCMSIEWTGLQWQICSATNVLQLCYRITQS